jgi:phosphoribosyl 1,2-cyclic phosphodiesterase
MKITFYGTRGSIPVPDRDFIQFGGNTSCVMLTLDEGHVIIFDAGTGIRKLGNDLFKQSYEQSAEIGILLSHTHWDHIQGFPFFGPAYDIKRKISFAICGRDRIGMDLYSIFATQMQQEYFPVPLVKMGARFTFWQPDISEYKGELGNKWEIIKHNHPGNAYSYRFTEVDSGKVFVYCTDIEHGDNIDQNVVKLARNADLLVHDAQYTPEELPQKKGWGHSSWEQAIQVAEQADVKSLALFHHDPGHDDTFLQNLETICQDRFPNAFFAREGAEIKL